MGRPVKPIGVIERASPRERGMLVGVPFARDWRPSEEEWQLGGIEFLEPLEAFGPIGRPDTGDMLTVADGGPWSYTQGACWQVCRPYGYPAAYWLLAGDGRVWAAEDFKVAAQVAQHTWGMSTDWQMSLCRWAPPIGQGVWPQVCIRMPAEKYCAALTPDPSPGGGGEMEVWDWWPSWVGLYLPMFDTQQWPDPLLHGISEVDSDWPDDDAIVPNQMGEVLDTYRSAGLVSAQNLMQHQVIWQTVRFEWFGDGWVRLGLSGSDQWWWAYLENTRLVPSTSARRLSVTVIGQMAAFHIGQMSFDGGQARARKAIRLPADCSMQEAQWELLAGEGSREAEYAPTWDLHGWELGCVNDTSGQVTPRCDEQRPLVTWTRPLFADPRVRVLVYNVRGSTPAVFGYEEPGSTSTTEGSGKLLSLEYTRDISGKGLRGTATFRASASVLCTDWTVNSTLRIHVAWESGLLGAETDLEVYLIKPIRRRAGEDRLGMAVYIVEFGDVVEARLRDHKELLDWAQAGGRLLGEWFRDLWERLGVPRTYVDVCAEAEEIVIPSGIPAGNDSFDCPDGTDPESHLDEVVFVCGFRWGVSRLNRPYLATRYSYVEGTSVITGTLDEAGSAEDALPEVETEWDVSLTANRIKYVVGEGETARAHYKGDSIEDRAYWPGDTWEKYVEVGSEAEEALVARSMADELALRERPVRFSYLARPNWEPGQYLRCQVDWVRIAMGAAVQLVGQSVTLDAETGTGTMDCEAVVVWEP